MKALASHLRDCKSKRKMLGQMVADLQAAGDHAQSDEQSGQSGAEEGEEEEAQADESDGDQADKEQPTYAEGDPHDLMPAAGGEEAAAPDDEKDPLIAQILDLIREAAQAREAADGAAERIHLPGDARKGESQAAQLRVTLADVRTWAEIGERCKRVEFHY